MPNPEPFTPPRETRYSLKKMLVEVAAERLSGAFGQEKLGQKDIRRVFKARAKGGRRET